MRDDGSPEGEHDYPEPEGLHNLADDGEEAAPPPYSLSEDFAALVSDGKTYVEAEVAFQKSRIAFTADRGKSAALYAIFALGFIHLALIALVVGMVFTLAPYIGGLGATLLVAGVLVLGAFILLLLMRGKTREIGEAFEKDDAE